MTTHEGVPRYAAPLPVLRDLELVRLGVLERGQLLGGSVPPPAEPGVARPDDSSTEPVTVRVALGKVDAARAEATGGLVIVDEEQTPVARLVRPVRVADGLMAGALEAARPSEHANTAYLDRPLDSVRRPAGPHRGARVLLVLRRPLLGVELRQVHELTVGGADLVIVVPDDQRANHGLPARLMVRLAADLARQLEPAGTTTHVAVAPIAWRDPSSDLALVARLARFTGAAAHAAPGVGPAAATDHEWEAALTAIRAGTGPATALPELSATAAHVLGSRWPQRDRRGLVVLFTGLSGSGKSTVARDLSEWLQRHTERTVTLLDGDVVRRLLSAGLGFDRAARVLNVRRIGFVAAEAARHGGLVIAAPIAPYAATRAEVRAMAEAVGDFLLVHVSTPLQECERRDLKGLYAQARAGLVAEFTGVSDPYETPTDADLTIDTSRLSRVEALTRVVDLLVSGGWVTPEPGDC